MSGTSAGVRLPSGSAGCTVGRSMPDRAAGRRGSSAAGGDCTRRFENAHRTILRELLYPWHPWFGKLVAIHETIDKAGGVVFRCTLGGAHADRWLEIPAWMFDRAACPDPPRLVTTPFVNMSALSALFDLLPQALKKRRSSSSKAPLSRASKFSHDQNRGWDDHAEIGATAGDPAQGPKASGKRRRSAKRSVQRAVAHADAGVAGSAGRGTPRPDWADEEADPGAHAGRRRRREQGGRP